MTDARKAAEVLRQFALKPTSGAPLAVLDAIGVLTDHVMRLEQTLDLIRIGVTSALADCPPNAVLSQRR